MEQETKTSNNSGKGPEIVELCYLLTRLTHTEQFGSFELTGEVGEGGKNVFFPPTTSKLWSEINCQIEVMSNKTS
jgi:hypothetical protein